MDKKKAKKTFGIAVDALMYTLMLVQMLYVFTGNNLHEWLGIGFFVCLVTHIILKRRWFALAFRRKGKILSARRFADLMIILLLLSIVLLMFSSMGVSRTIFPDVKFFGDPDIHRLLATLSLTFAVIHGGMHWYFRSKNKKKAVIGITILAIAAFSIGEFGVPYLNRHLRVVEIDSNVLEVSGDSEWKGDKPLVAYFSRMGNTNFDEDIDAVSGASLMVDGGELKGNTQFMAEMLDRLIDCDVKAITITDYAYPSSYAETCVVGGQEIKDDARPNIEPIDVTSYDSVILVYPIWWGTIPAPVATFLDQNDFSGKKVYLLATQGSSGFVSSTKDIMKLIPDAEVIEARSIYCDDIPKSGEILAEWLDELGR